MYACVQVCLRVCVYMWSSTVNTMCHSLRAICLIFGNRVFHQHQRLSDPPASVSLSVGLKLYIITLSFLYECLG